MNFVPVTFLRRSAPCFGIQKLPSFFLEEVSPIAYFDRLCTLSIRTYITVSFFLRNSLLSRDGKLRKQPDLYSLKILHKRKLEFYVQLAHTYVISWYGTLLSLDPKNKSRSLYFYFTFECCFRFAQKCLRRMISWQLMWTMLVSASTSNS